MNIKKLLPCLLALTAIPAFADASTAVAKKLGPVSYYGALGSANGQVIGTKTNKPAIVRGMSWFWSDATGLPYYSPIVLDWATDNLKIDVIRFAMGIQYYDDSRKNEISDGYSYKSVPDSYMTIIDQMVEAAIENDIYIIIDWHSHLANGETSMAKTFFTEVAKKYGKIPNVIFEIFNEPTCGWSEVASYANSVIPGIRASSDNLIIVGNPGWSSQPNSASGLSYTNLAYAMHFYAASHSASRNYGSNVTSAISSGKAVFASEYGTVNYDGAGTPNESATNAWYDLMDKNNVSSCNWSLRQVKSTENGTVKNETSAFFDGDVELTSKALLDAATPSTSGKIVKAYLTKSARNWAELATTGKRSGSCAADHITVNELAGSVASKLKSGCTYTSSNPNVVSNTGEITGSGYSIMTGNDGTETVVTISAVPAQTVPNHVNLTCNYSGSCTTNRTLDFTGSGSREWIVSIDNKTLEGSTFTLTSLNPEVLEVTTGTCTNNSCSTAQKGNKVILYRFKGFGEAKVVASAPAVTGYKAVQDTVTVIYNKGNDGINSKFKKRTLAFGESVDMLPDLTSNKTPLTYTFNGAPTSQYVTKNGTNLVAGNQNAIVNVTASAPETALYQAFQKTVTVVVGDSTQAVNKDELISVDIVKTNAALPLRAVVTKSQLAITSDNAGSVNVDVFSINGQKVFSKTVSENSIVPLAGIPNGSYLIVINQGVRQLNVKWNKTGK